MWQKQQQFAHKSNMHFCGFFDRMNVYKTMILCFLCIERILNQVHMSFSFVVTFFLELKNAETMNAW